MEHLILVQNKTKNCIWHPQTSLYRKSIQESWDKVFYEINLDVLECLIDNIVKKNRRSKIPLLFFVSFILSCNNAKTVCFEALA